MLGLAILALACAALPGLIAWVNLSILRTPEPDLDVRSRISVLIPARNEAAVIATTVRAALASAGVALEVLVGDDHSTDDTAAIVAGIAVFTVSTAASTATLGIGTPSARTSSAAFSRMSALAIRSGAMFMAASVTKSGFG